MNPHRGHESKPHIEAKVAVGRLFNRRDWTVFFEQREADILAMHIPTRFLAAIEIESTPRNVLRNIQRDLSNGCHAIATVALQKRFHKQIENRIRKQSPGEFGTYLQVFPYDAEGLIRLAGWINGLAQSHGNQVALVSINQKTKEKNP